MHALILLPSLLLTPPHPAPIVCGCVYRTPIHDRQPCKYDDVGRQTYSYFYRALFFYTNRPCLAIMSYPRGWLFRLRLVRVGRATAPAYSVILDHVLSPLLMKTLVEQGTRSGRGGGGGQDIEEWFLRFKV